MNESEMDNLSIRRLDAAEPGFAHALRQVLAFEASEDEAIDRAAAEILADVRQRGDDAVLEYTRRFDRLEAASMGALELSQSQLEAALEDLEPQAPRRAGGRRRARAGLPREAEDRMRQPSLEYTEADGTMLGQQVTPLDRVGLYVPGGKAAYPSSVLMNAIPARVAGVKEMIMVVPTPGGVRNQLVLAAAQIAGVDRVFTIGGAQAVGALAYGTATHAAGGQDRRPRQRLRGRGQAPRVRHGRHRHDRRAVRDPGDLRRHHRPGLGGDGPVLAGRARRTGAVDPAVPGRRLPRTAWRPASARLLPTMPRARRDPCLAGGPRRADQGARYGGGVRDRQRHRPGTPGDLRREPAASGAEKIRHAGAIFLGRYTSESLGDYCAGPNHVLPTSRTARFSSPLGVYDFQKRSSLIEVSEAGAQMLGQIAAELAYGEGLQAHARSAEYRFKRG